MATADVKERQSEVRTWWTTNKFNPPYRTYVSEQDAQHLENWVDMQARVAAANNGSILANDTKWKVIQKQLEYPPLWIARYLKWGNVTPEAMRTRYHTIYKPSNNNFALRAERTITESIAVDDTTLLEWIGIIGGQRDPNNPSTPNLPTETANEWKTRMRGMLYKAANTLEAAIGQLTPQLYTHGDDYMTATLTTTMLQKMSNVGVHPRLQIGFLWHDVDVSTPHPTRRPETEKNVTAAYKNMETVEKIKAFFHKHNELEWNKVRHAAADNRENQRRIHLWNTGFTIGKLLLDVNLKHTKNGALHELNARAEFYLWMTQHYQKAAKGG